MQRPNEMNDRQLLTAYVARQDLHAFDAFVDRHQAALLSFAAAFLRDETTAQDVVQEAFLRAARHPQRLLDEQRQPGSERNWLLKVVRDLSVDNLRQRATEKKAVAQMARIAPQSTEAPETQLLAAERGAEVRSAMDRLKPRLRELLILKVREQKSYKEIAQITNLSVTNVGFLLHQAMQALGTELRKPGSAGVPPAISMGTRPSRPPSTEER